MLKYLFCDFDGVILYSEPLYQKFWIEACQENGFSLSIEQELPLRSRDHQLTEKYFHELFGEKAIYEEIVTSRKRLMNEYLNTHQIPLKDGVLPFLKYVKEETNIKIAIVTSSSEEYVQLHGGYNQILPYIDEIISARNVKRGKPFPYVYQEAIKKAQIREDEVLVLEDSSNGVIAAYEAGLRVIFVEDLSPVDEQIKKMSVEQIKNTMEMIPIIEKYNK